MLSFHSETRRMSCHIISSNLRATSFKCPGTLSTDFFAVIARKPLRGGTDAVS